MKLNSILQYLACVFFIALSSSVFAKDKFAVCAFEIEAQASRQQSCLVIQETKKQCDTVTNAYQNTVTRCKNKKMPTERVLLATDIGVGKIKGDPKQSPWQIKLAIIKTAQELIAENRYRYESTFQGQVTAPESLKYDFNTDECAVAYKSGNEKKWIFWQQLTAYANAELDLPLIKATASKSKLPNTHLWFLSMKKNQCYRPGTTDLTTQAAFPDNTNLIYNISNSWLNKLAERFLPVISTETRGNKNNNSPFRLSKPIEVEVEKWAGPLRGVISVHRCYSASLCKADFAQFEKYYAQYTTALQNTVRAKTCLKYLKPNETGEINIDTLFAFPCTQENANSMIKENERIIIKMESLLLSQE